MATQVIAADFTIEAPDLQSLPARVVAAIKTVDSEAKSSKIVGVSVDLDGDNNKTDWAATTADGCACGNVVCPIWLVRENRVVLSYGGYDLTLGREKQAGLRHAAIAAASAGWKQQSLWKFDG